MTAILLPQGKQQYFSTATGLPLVGGKVFTYDAGTNNPRTTWADAAQVGANANPIILDARGEASIFWAGAYKVQLQDALGNVIWTQDNVTSLMQFALDNYAVDSGAVNAYAAAGVTVGAYVAGLRVSVKIANTNTGASTLNYGGLGAKSIKLTNGAALVGGELIAGGLAELEYDGVNFQLLSVLPFIGRTVAETAAGAVVINGFYNPGELLRYGNNTVPGTTDMTAAYQAAVNQALQATGAAVVLPAQPILTTAPITGVLTNGLAIYGAGLGKTRITKQNDSSWMTFTSSASSNNQLTIQGMTVFPSAAMAAGNGIDLTGGGAIPTLTIRDLAMVASGVNTFRKFINTIDAGETFYERVFLYGLGAGTGSLQGFSVNSVAPVGSAATVHKFFGCEVYNCTYGVSINNNSNPGIEGVQFYGCGHRGRGLRRPVHQRIRGHILPAAVQLHRRPHQRERAQPRSGDHGAALHSGRAAVQRRQLRNDQLGVGQRRQYQRQHVRAHCGNVSGITIATASAPINGGIIANNIFRLGAGTGNAINIVAAGIVNLNISGNQRTGGTKTLAITGTLDGSVILTNNTPDQEDLYESPGAFAATPTLVGLRSTYIIYSAPGGATTMTTLTPRRLGDIVTIECSSALATIQHNGAVFGFILQGGVNFVFPATGGRITLRLLNGNVWKEICRSI
jgi:hypothetical protein